MRKLRITIALLLTFIYSISVSAELIEEGVKPEGASADISLITESVYGIFDTQDIEFSVKMKSGADNNSVFLVTTECGENIKNYETVLMKNKMIQKNYSVKCPIGTNSLKIKVYCNNQELSTLDQNVNVAPYVKEYFMEDATSKVGYTSAYDYDRYRKFMKMNGSLISRAEMGLWHGIETKKGVYDFTYADSYMPITRDMGFSTMALMTYNNWLYSDKEAIQAGPDDKANIDAYAKYVYEIAKRYPWVKEFEIWNEPNGGLFNNIDPYFDYTYVTEVVAQELKKLGDDKLVMMGSVANSDAPFINNCFEIGLWPNCDKVSYHPYVTPSRADDALPASIHSVHDIIVSQGGWKVPINSEMGWPSIEIGRGVSEERQAIELPKACIISISYGVPEVIIYHAFDTSSDPTDDSELHYGVVRHPYWDPKPSFFTVRQANDCINGSIYLGKAYQNNEDIMVYMFARDSKIHAAVWSKGEKADVDFGKSVTSLDMNGNPYATGEVLTVGEEPIYVDNIDKNWVVKNISINMAEIFNDRMTNFTACKDKKGFSEAENLILNNVNRLQRLNTIPTATEAEVLLDEHYSVNNKLMEMYANGELDIELKQLSGLMYVNHLMGEYLVGLYMLCDDAEQETDISATIATISNEIDELKKDNTLPVSESIFKFAQEYADKVKIAKDDGKNTMKNGAINAWSKAAEILAKEAKLMATVEPIACTNVLLQLPSSEKNIQLGKDSEVHFSLYNYRENTKLTGHIEVYGSDNVVYGKSDTITLNPGESRQIPVTIRVDEVSKERYRMRFVENGAAIVDRISPVTVQEQLNVKFQSMMKPFDEINEITIKLENVFDGKVSGKINVKPRCDWTLTQEEQLFEVEPGETEYITYKVSSKEREAYNFYAFDIKIENSDGHIIFDKYLPIDFTVVAKAKETIDPSKFEGNISDWSDAYPIYCDTPKNPEEYNEWKNEDVGARLMMKWDNEYYYVLCDIFDQFHANMQVGTNIWNGDSLQLAWDTQNDNAWPYNGDDYEYGAAHTENGDKVFCWMAGTKATGERDVSWLKVIQNKQEHLTRYLLRIPANELTPLDFKEGTVFGFNFLVNDADWTAREKSIEYTEGISRHKNTGYYDDFMLIGNEEASTKEAKIPILTTLEGTSTNTEFNDVHGHWAEGYIKSVAKQGYMSGVGNGCFEPDREITRAEFVTAVMRLYGQLSKEDKGYYFDIPENIWYEDYVNSAASLGWISNEIADTFFSPEKVINREEAFSILASYVKNELGVTLDVSSGWTSNDFYKVSDWSKKDIVLLHNLGIVNGDNAGNINPDMGLTRAEMAVLLFNSAKL